LQKIVTIITEQSLSSSSSSLSSFYKQRFGILFDSSYSNMVFLKNKKGSHFYKTLGFFCNFTLVHFSYILKAFLT